MPNYNFRSIDLPDDIGSPLSLYQHVRNIYPESLLLECLEYKDAEKARSFICADPIYSLAVRNGVLAVESVTDGVSECPVTDLLRSFGDFLASIESTGEGTHGAGVYGYSAYDSIPYLEDIKFKEKERGEIPQVYYALYRYVFIFDHSTHRASLVYADHGEEGSASLSKAQKFVEAVSYGRPPQYRFSVEGSQRSSLTDEQFLSLVDSAKSHIRRGDVFQVVISRQFRQAYKGDEFEVYRALRKINPSPFLFFFDYGSYSLFGSSPEAQLIVRDGRAKMFPIAGTCPRGATPEEDDRFEAALTADPKENSEHVMLVDLARNDLGRSCSEVEVLRFREAERYSHVMHLVSCVGARVDGATAFEVFRDTFPAGTLSGAPKYRAMQIIDELEPVARMTYGGSLGFFSLNGDCIQAIIIRSFLTHGGELISQAGAGIVSGSVPEMELTEVKNKLGALRGAVDHAHTRHSNAAKEACDA